MPDGRVASPFASLAPLDIGAMDAVRARLGRLTKPAGSLGQLESLAVQLAGIRGEERATRPLLRRSIVVMAADHGVAARGVSAYPAAVTAQMVANMRTGGAAINVLARMVGADLLVVDLGVAGAVPSRGSAARFRSARIADGTRDLSVEPAMTRAEALAAVDIGREIARELAADDVDVVAVGEMGIGNTTAASALTAALTVLDPGLVTGRGTGLDDLALARKIAVVREALALHRPDPADPCATLAALGGLEIAGLVGLIAELAVARIPVVLDGFITGAAALVAASLVPSLPPRLIAGHRSVEPGHRVQLEALGLRPVLDLDLRLGEASGAILAIPILDAAVRLLAEMATFDSAGVAGASRARPGPHGRPSDADRTGSTALG
jgi:nicotinate-nucleotide--dimethylbenzimidazole phosphoribosyltransferase